MASSSKELEKPSYEEATERGSSKSSVTEDIPPEEKKKEYLDLAETPTSYITVVLGCVCRHPTNLDAEVTELAISTQGYVAISSPASRGTDIWDCRGANPHKAQRLSGNHVVFSASGKFLATVRESYVTSTDGGDVYYSSAVKVKESTTWRTALEPNEAKCRPVAFSPDGQKFATGTEKNRLIIYESTGKQVPGTPPRQRVCTIMNHIDRITHAQFTPDGSCIVTLSKDSTLRVTDSRTGRTRQRLEIQGSSNPRVLAVSPDGDTIISIWSTTVHIWQLATSELTSYNLNLVRTTEGWPLCISPNCQYLACRNEDGLDISNVYTGEVLHAIQKKVPVTAAAFSFDSCTLVIGYHDGKVELWKIIECSA